MRSMLNRVKDSVGKSESGFTMVEMLIVMGIIVALAAAIVPQMASFGGTGEEGQKSAEKSAIQMAMDSTIADAGKSVVTAETTNARNDWQTYPVGPSPIKKLEKYLAITSTTWFYCWDTKGKITKQLDTAAAC